MVVRDELERGALAAQVTHAAGESSRLADLPPGTHAVVLQTSESGLHLLEQQLAEAGVLHAAIREPDPPFHGALVAIGLAPAPKQSLKRFLSNLRLLR